MERLSSYQEEVMPSSVQQAFMDLKFGMFIHYGINTFYNTESSDGALPLFNFDPSVVDTDQWCNIAKLAGMNYVVLTAKASDGFCLWPSRYSNYTIAHTPYKKDILEDLVDSANKVGLKVGISFSLWDEHVMIRELSDEVYVEFILNQLEELLTGYGPMIEIWFDSFWYKYAHGWKGENGFAAPGDEFLISWRMEGAYRWRWDYIYTHVKDLQPDCLVLNNSTRVFPGLPLLPVDVRNAEKGQDMEEDRKVWQWLGEDLYLPLQIETTLSQKGTGKFLDGYWYWHKGDNSIAKRWKANNWRRNAEKLKANLLLNVGPSVNGKLRPEDEKLLLRLG